MSCDRRCLHRNGFFHHYYYRCGAFAVDVAVVFVCRLWIAVAPRRVRAASRSPPLLLIARRLSSNRILNIISAYGEIRMTLIALRCPEAYGECANSSKRFASRQISRRGDLFARSVAARLAPPPPNRTEKLNTFDKNRRNARMAMKSLNANTESESERRESRATAIGSSEGFVAASSALANILFLFFFALSPIHVRSGADSRR